MIIRPSDLCDIPEIRGIYAKEVQHGTASFETEPPDLEEMTTRWKRIKADGFPFLVAELHGNIAGYAYASRYRSRPAYRHTVENSVYVAEWARQQGVGRTLLVDLIQACEDLGLRQMIAVIGDSNHVASIALHKKLGFRLVGTLDDVGLKFGGWLDTVIMQRALGEGATSIPATTHPAR
jgi:phosphinothricin acetyltransferase